MRHAFTMEYWQDEGWYVGRLREVSGVFSQGGSSELEENIRDAYELVRADAAPAPVPAGAESKRSRSKCEALSMGPGATGADRRRPRIGRPPPKASEEEPSRTRARSWSRTSGTHELMAHGGRYAELFDLQAAGYRGSEPT